MADLIANISVITLNVNGLNMPIKRHRLAEQILKTKQKCDPITCYLQETHFSFNNIGRFKVKGW